MSKKLYIASPFGFSEAGRDYLYGTILPTLMKLDYEIIDPWHLTSTDLIKKVSDLPYGAERRAEWYKLNKIIGENNARALATCDGVFAILDGVDVDSGTAAEIGFAAALGKPIVGYRGDFRLSADNEGALVNLQVQYFIEHSGGKLITELSQLLEAIEAVFESR